MLAKILLPLATKSLKPMLKKLSFAGEVYKKTIPLEPGEVDISALVFIINGRLMISPCTLRSSSGGKLEVSRCLAKYEEEEIGDLLLGLLEKADTNDLSEIL